MSRKLTSRKVTPARAFGRHRSRRGRRAKPFPGAGHRAGRTVQARPADRQDRTARPGRHPDGAGRAHLSEGKRLHDRRPQGRLRLRRYRRQSGRHQDQGAGTGRARQSRCYPRPARRLRALCHQRLYPATENADAQSRGGRRPDAAQAQSVSVARLGDLFAGDAADGALCGDRAEAQARRLPSSRISPSATSRWAASRRRSRRTAAASSTSCGRRWSRPTTRPMSRRSAIATACVRALPAPIRCAS